MPMYMNSQEMWRVREESPDDIWNSTFFLTDHNSTLSGSQISPQRSINKQLKAHCRKNREKIIITYHWSHLNKKSNHFLQVLWTNVYKLCKPHSGSQKILVKLYTMLYILPAASFFGGGRLEMSFIPAFHSIDISATIAVCSNKQNLCL